jgi:hypothetical protein
MTLGDMRSLGVRSLTVACELCHHEAVLAADEWSDAVLVRAAQNQPIEAKNLAPVEMTGTGPVRGFPKNLSVPRHDRPLAEGKLTNRSFTNRCGHHRRRLFSRQISGHSTTDHRDRRDGCKQKLQHWSLLQLDRVIAAETNPRQYHAK